MCHLLKPFFRRFFAHFSWIPLYLHVSIKTNQSFTPQSLLQMKILSFKFLLVTLLLSSSILAQNGLQADYYDGTNFNRLVGTRIESEINHYWRDSPPFAGMNPNECSVRWTGRIQAPETGDIKFSARVDDGIRVWVGGVQVIDNWQLNDVGYSDGSVKLTKGKFYDIKIEYFNALYEAEIRLYWTMPRPENLSWYESFFYDDKTAIVPAQALFQPYQPEEEVVEAEPIPEKIIPPTPEIKKPAPVKKPVVEKELTIESYIPKNVQFERAKTEILPTSYAELDKLAGYLNENPHHKIKIEGHTDNVGDAAKNIELSERRARAVAAYLIKKGVSHERLSAEGFGGTKPLVKNDGRKYHPENRRVEFIVE